MTRQKAFFRSNKSTASRLRGRLRNIVTSRVAGGAVRAGEPSAAEVGRARPKRGRKDARERRRVCTERAPAGERVRSLFEKSNFSRT